jgi:hypothetical protein
MSCRSWIMVFASFLTSGAAYAQLAQIRQAKLPQDEPVKTAYSKVLPVESMAHDWNPKWAHDTPKEQVVAILTSSLLDLRSAETREPENAELFLLTGLVAHLAYNVDVEEAYQTAVDSLEQAHKLAPGDYRAGWFLGMHRCQSDDVKGGMEQLLGVENQVPWQQLPIEFWNDYMTCSTVSLMPAHTLRAVDYAMQLGASPAAYYSLVDIAHKRYKSTDAETTYPAHNAWRADEGEHDIRFTSQLCGVAFSTHRDWHMDIRDVTKGTCLAIIETGPYPSKTGQSVPTLLLLTRPPKFQETLNDFVQSFLKKYPTARQVAPTSCPSDKCVAYEIISNVMYQPEGGGHLLLLGFAGQPTDFPGLFFEKPEAPPKGKSGDKLTYYVANERLNRLPGVLYTIVELDSNDSIYPKAATDFQYLLKSIQLD